MKRLSAVRISEPRNRQGRAGADEALGRWRGMDGAGRGVTTDMERPSCVGGRCEHKWLRRESYAVYMSWHSAHSNELIGLNVYGYAVLCMIQRPACHARAKCLTASPLVWNTVPQLIHALLGVRMLNMICPPCPC